MKGRKVTVVGAGNVGSTIAFILAMNGVCHEIWMRDNKVNVAKGRALDMSQAAQAGRSHAVVRAAETPKDIAGSDIVVITAGSPRKPGMSRDDLLFINAEIMKSICLDIKEHAPNSIIVVVSNPLDAMVYTALRSSGFDRDRVLGMAGILDSARMASFIQQKLGYGAGQIRASVMGGHGDDMVPLPRYSTVAGVGLYDLLTPEEIDGIVHRTRHGGAEIVELLQTGSAYYAPAKATAMMVESIMRDTKQIHPCAVMMNGEYGYNNIVSGVPIMIGAKGVEKVIEVNLNDDEKAAFGRSVASVQTLVDKLENANFFGGL
ncbi:MAG TPA: malate dehydrogenase [Campylobacterales bacterium]|nr:malate dehydrogenase [Campylobacterales bacterium]